MNEQSKNEASNVGVEVEYAGFWIRVAAYIADQIILGIMLFLFAFVLGLWAYSIFPEHLADSFSIIVGALSYPLFVILFWVYRQATPGKMAVNLKIVDAGSGGKPSTGQCIGRYFAYIPSFVFLGLGFLWIAFDDRKQGWHDKLAGTVVIKKEPRRLVIKEEPRN
ncbi:MAG: RDD family protein [Gammaproteobacteria bacterium]|nr:RDD family protein [Gammaproteobacteria bacterium]